MLLMYGKISSGEEADSETASGNRSIKAGMVRFTRLSVHWAERITATSNSYGSLKTSSVSASGRLVGGLKSSAASLRLSVRLRGHNPDGVGEGRHLARSARSGGL